MPRDAVKISFARKFHTNDIEAWKAMAERETDGNLTKWMEDRLNQPIAQEPLRKILTRIEDKLDQVLGEYVEWE